MSSEAIKQIMRAIQANTALQILDISSNSISDDGAVAISECLKYNKTLEVVDISKNAITEGEIIANSIQENTTLLKLHLHNNRISLDRVVAISECLTTMQTTPYKSLAYRGIVLLQKRPLRLLKP